MAYNDKDRNIASSILNRQGLSDDKTRQIVKDEMDKNYRSGSPRVPRHKHDGNDNIKIPNSSIVYPNPVNGTIDMAQQSTYKLFLTNSGQTPQQITFYGGALNTTSDPKVHAMIVGNAQYGVNKQFQPSTSTTVVSGSVTTKIIQGSASIIIENRKSDGTAGNTIIKNSQGHIIYAEYPSGTVVVAGNVTEINESYITIEIITLASNWSISGLWTIT